MAILTLKVYCNGEIRRIPFDPPGNGGPIYSNLVQRIRISIPDLDLVMSTINWKDDEGDFIVLRTDEEVTEAIKNAKDSVLKLYIIGKNDPKPPPSIASSVILEDEEKGSIMDEGYPPEGDQGTQEPVDDGDDTEEEPQIHRGVVCDGCDGLISGRRFKCCVCYDYDLCAECEQKGTETGDHKSTHPMILLSRPRVLRQFPWLRFMMRRMSGHCPQGPPPGCPFFPGRGPPPPFDGWVGGGRWGPCGGGPRGGRGHHWGVHHNKPGCKRGPGHGASWKGGRRSAWQDWVREMREAMDASVDPPATEAGASGPQEKGQPASATNAMDGGTAAEILRCVGENVANVLEAFGISVSKGNGAMLKG